MLSVFRKELTIDYIGAKCEGFNLIRQINCGDTSVPPEKRTIELAPNDISLMSDRLLEQLQFPAYFFLPGAAVYVEIQIGAGGNTAAHHQLEAH